MPSKKRSTPTFIGIGATKSGSSWLYSILASHKDVYAPVKEINYFTLHFENGVDWYKDIFAAGDKHLQTGEMTPTYLYDENVSKLISEQAPTAKILVILRNPVYRAYSQFKTDYYIGKTKCESFEKYLEENPVILQRGLYSLHLENYLKWIPRNRIKIFIFEEETTNTATLKNKLAEFLDIDPMGFDDQQLSKKVNVSDPPKFRMLYQYGVKAARFMHRNKMYKASKFVKRTGSKLFKILGHSKHEAPRMTDDTYDRLMEFYAADMTKLKQLMGRKESIW